MIPFSRPILQQLFVADTGNKVSVDDDVDRAFVDAQNNPTRDNVERYAILAQVSAFVRKARDSGGVSQDLKRAAVLKHFEIEADNRRINQTFASGLSLDWLEEAKHWISCVLPPLSIVEPEMWEYCRFGKGATYNGCGPEGRHLLTKIAGDSHSVTRRALGIFLHVISEYYPRWGSLLMRKKCTIVPGNRVEFVPKDVRKCRTIAVEPSCNMFLQLGVGTFIARRLRLFGVNLRDQTINRERARDGSIDGSLATIDLSDASSRISRECVRALLPPDWFHLLDSIRSPQGRIDGSFVTYQMFSSQGNGFTFPLESLIFWAIARTVTKDVTVYGDDIVVPTDSYELVTSRLGDCGFVVNHEKSFQSGSFRESCGGDYIEGLNVRPIFLKDDFNTPADVACFHNLLLTRWGHLPLTLKYLTSLVRKPLYGYPGAYKASETDLTSNTKGYRLRSCFWTSNPFLVTKKEWVESTSVPKWIEDFTRHERWLYTLYTSGYKSVLQNNRITTRVVTLEPDAIIYDPPPYDSVDYYVMKEEFIGSDS